MIVVRSLSHIAQISDPDIRHLVRQRIDDLGGDAFDTTELGYLLVVEVADTLDALSAQMGFPILCNRWTGISFGQPEFTPSFELVEEFPSCFDLVFVLSDDGFGIEVFVPKADGVNPELLAMCRQYATHREA